MLTPERPSNIRPPGNPLGEWIDLFTDAHHLGIRQFGDLIDLHGIGNARTNPSEKISLYTIQTILESVERFNPSEEEIDTLADAVELCVDETLRIKGKLYDRLPPVIARTKQKGFEGVSYTDTQLATELGVNSSRIFFIRQKLKITTPVFRQECAERIKKYLKESYEDKPLSDGFVAVFSEVENVREREFISKMMIITGLSKNALISIKNGRNPTPEEFGVILEKFEPNEEQVEKLLDEWITTFRNSILMDDLGKEFGITRQGVQQLAKRMGFGGGNRHLTWEQIEAMREKRNGVKGVPVGKFRQKKHSKTQRIKNQKTLLKTIRQELNEVVTKVEEPPEKNIEPVKKLIHSEEEIEAVKDRYPKVLTPGFLSSLTSKEATAVIKLNKSSFQYPVELSEDDRMAVDYMMREKIYPEGTKILSKRNGFGRTVYFFEYLRV
jgi:hypothetical protein